MSALTGELSINQVGDQTFLVYHPQADGVLWEREEILRLLSGGGVRIDDPARFDAALSELADGAESALVVEKVDGSFSIDVGDNKMNATLTARKPLGGGDPLSLKVISAAIIESGFKPLEKERIREGMLRWYRSDSLVLTELPLCDGRPAEAGRDAEVDWVHPFLSEKASATLRERLAGAERPDSAEQFPAEQAQQFAEIDAQQIISTLLPSRPATPGADVFGSPIEGLAGREPTFELHENVTRRENDFVSSADGVLEVSTNVGDDEEVTVHMRVRPLRDARVAVEVAADRVLAYLTLLPRAGIGAEAEVDRITAVLEEAGVVHGLDNDAILQALDAQGAGNATERVVVARATEPLHGDTGRIEYRVAVASGRRATAREDGSVDHKQHDEFSTVKAGEVIADVYPPDVAPTDGVDVLGGTLQARDAKPLQIEAGQNVRRIDAAGESTISFVATKAGKLEIAGNVLSVSEVLVVASDIGVASGNVRFAGAVQINGDVHPGYSVVSDNDVVITGVVDRALVSSGASIHVGQGVIGGGKAILGARSEIHAQFAEQAMLMSVGGVHIRSSCLRCSVKSNGKVALDVTKGDFVGGTVRARGGLEVRNLGSERGARTEVSFGQNYLAADRIDKEEADLARLNKRSQELTMNLARGEHSGGDAGELERIQAEKVQLLKAIEAKSFRLFTLRESFEEHTPAEVVVQGTLYPGVVFESHGRYYDIKTEKKQVVITFNEKLGQIEERPLTERRVPTDASASAAPAAPAAAPVAEAPVSAADPEATTAVAESAAASVAESQTWSVI